MPLNDPPRLFFSSYHGLLDPSSGAALAVRDLLELMAARGWPCGVLCGPQLDFESPPPLEKLLRGQGLPFDLHDSPAGGRSFRLFHLHVRGVPVTLYEPTGRPPRPLTSHNSDEGFLRVFDGVLDRFRPDLLLSYGGDGTTREVVRRAKQKGRAVVFGLHNFAYHDAALFRDIDAIWVPSRFAAEHYRSTLGLNCTVLPNVWDWSRVRCSEVQGRYVTFVNPQPQKGAAVFARIALELGRRRPDVPFLVVEGRGRAERLSQTGLDLSGLTNLHRMTNTPDPRDFYRVSKMILMPSLDPESFGRVAAESLINGIPVLASRRGELPETLADAGFLFDVPARCKPESGLVPTAEEVEPWIAAILRLWDDADFHDAERRRCLTAAETWRPEQLLPRFEAFFRAALRSEKRIGSRSVENPPGRSERGASAP